MSKPKSSHQSVPLVPQPKNAAKTVKSTLDKSKGSSQTTSKETDNVGEEENLDSSSENTSTDESEGTAERESEQSKKDQVVASAFLDELIVRLMSAPVEVDANAKNNSKRRFEHAHIIPVHLTYHELDMLCSMAIRSFLKQPSLLVIDRSQLPITIVGDIHGQFKDLRAIFHRCGAPNIQSYLFLGRSFSVTIVYLISALKIKYPTRIYLLRGNHEDANTCSSYGFFDECASRFENSKQGEQIWKKFVSVFNCIPLAALVNKSILAMHGGISPNLDSLETIAKLERPSIIPPYGLMCDLVWSDPEEKLDGWSMNSRGISLSFSDQVTEAFCQRFEIDLIVRGHQLTQEMISNGYRFFAKGRLVTLFSAPNYLNMRNSAAVLRVSKKMKCRFVVFRIYKRQRKR